MAEKKKGGSTAKKASPKAKGAKSADAKAKKASKKK